MCIVYYTLGFFSHVENGFNHIKDEFLAYQVSRGSDPSPDQNMRCTCPYTSFNQPGCLESNLCPYLHERTVWSYIL